MLGRHWNRGRGKVRRVCPRGGHGEQGRSARGRGMRDCARQGHRNPEEASHVDGWDSSTMTKEKECATEEGSYTERCEGYSGISGASFGRKRRADTENNGRAARGQGLWQHAVQNRGGLGVAHSDQRAHCGWRGAARHVRVAEHALDQLEEAIVVLLRGREESDECIGGRGRGLQCPRRARGGATSMMDLAPVSGAVAMGSVVWCVPTPAASTAAPALARIGTTLGVEPMSRGREVNGKSHPWEHERSPRPRRWGKSRRQLSRLWRGEGRRQEPRPHREGGRQRRTRHWWAHGRSPRPRCAVERLRPRRREGRGRRAAGATTKSGERQPPDMGGKAVVARWVEGRRNLGSDYHIGNPNPN